MLTSHLCHLRQRIPKPSTPDFLHLCCAMILFGSLMRPSQMMFLNKISVFNEINVSNKTKYIELQRKPITLKYSFQNILKMCHLVIQALPY